MYFYPYICLYMQTLRQLRDAFEAVVTTYCAPRTPSGLYDPVAYILQLGGKRVRPILCAAGYHFGNRNQLDSMWTAALALEVFHNFSLVHDDIMDDAPLRRGHPTVHQAWNIPTAILSGDIMLIEVYRLLSQSADTDILPLVLDRFHHTAVGVCEGQQLDMDFEASNDVAWSDYVTMIRGKTAILLGGSLEIGGLMGGVPVHEARLLSEAGMSLGMSFQLMDDWLDAFGDPKKTGKVRYGDILRRKKTALVHQAMGLSLPEDREILQGWYKLNAEDRPGVEVSEIAAILDRSGAGDAVLEQARSMHMQALELLDGIPSRRGGRELLNQLMAELQGRDS